MGDAAEKTDDEADMPKFTAKADGADPVATRVVKEMKHDRGILTCAYHPAGRYIFAASRDYFLHRWDLSMEAPVEEPDPKAKNRGFPQSPLLLWKRERNMKSTRVGSVVWRFSLAGSV